MYFTTQGTKNATCYGPFFKQSARKTHLLQSSRTRVAYISKIHLMVFTGRICHFRQGPTCYAVFAYTLTQKLLSSSFKHLVTSFRNGRLQYLGNQCLDQQFCFAERLSSIFHVCYLLVTFVLFSLVVSCLVLSCRVLSCLVLSCFVLP